VTGSGAPDFVIVSVGLAGAATVLSASEVLLLLIGSGVVELTVATLARIVPSLTEGETVVTTVKSTLPAANDAVEQVMVPLDPTAGVVQLQPAFGEIDWKRTPAGNGSVSVTVDASSGPSLLTVSV
jgi:hypothetical protein